VTNEMNKPWGQVSFEEFSSTLTKEVQGLMPTWSEMSDSAQVRWEEHARKITQHVSERYFPSDVENQTKAFDMGQGNLDLTEHLFED
jgi:hypothetical protein